jgi:hypothetical protein
MGGNHVTGFSSCSTAEGCGSDVPTRVEARFAMGDDGITDNSSCQSVLTLCQPDNTRRQSNFRGHFATSRRWVSNALHPHPECNNTSMPRLHAERQGRDNGDNIFFNAKCIRGATDINPNASVAQPTHHCRVRPDIRFAATKKMRGSSPRMMNV